MQVMAKPYYGQTKKEEPVRKLGFGDLVGQTIVGIDLAPDNEVVTFRLKDGRSVVMQHQQDLVMQHQQDCCEHVYLHDIAGDLTDIMNVPVLQAEESSNSDNSEKPEDQDYADDSHTWTFYRITTIRGTVVMRWYGSSNGYYSESVYCSWQ